MQQSASPKEILELGFTSTIVSAPTIELLEIEVGFTSPSTSAPMIGFYI